MRIIAGSARGRNIETPTGLSTRPTLNRVKESLFGIIQFDLFEARVLDLFSGSGSLGLEAISRGAELAVMNDFDPKCVEIIRKNTEKLGFSDRAQIANRDYQAQLLSLRGGKPFDLIFLDPPYSAGMAQRAVELIFELGLLAQGGKIIVEHDLKDKTEYMGRVLSVRKYHDTALTLLTHPEQD